MFFSGSMITQKRSRLDLGKRLCHPSKVLGSLFNNILATPSDLLCNGSNLVSDVQRKCSQVMGAMGYKLVNPKDTQLHDLDHLIVPWRNGVPNWIELLTQNKL